MSKKEKDEESLQRKQYPLIDLTPISRMSGIVRTSVYLNLTGSRGPALEWVRFGQGRLRIPQNDWNCASLEGYLGQGATDFEHDSAYLIRMEVLGANFKGVDYHVTTVTGWVTNDPDQFRVPPPNYNPMVLPDAYVCKERRCGKRHPIVPQGYYVPPFDKELFLKMRGQQITIEFSVYPREE